MADVSMVDPAGLSLGLVNPENEPCIRKALEEQVLFASVALHISKTRDVSSSLKRAALVRPLGATVGNATYTLTCLIET